MRFNVKKIPQDYVIVHSKWDSVPDGYDSVYNHYQDYLIEFPCWNVDDCDEWKKEVRQFIEDEAKKDRYTLWENITIWYELPGKEIRL